MSVILRI